jgi:hypothetical protein
MDIIEGVRTAIKEMMLPELDRIREENQEIKAILEMTNKRLDDMNLHLADQSRRIDAVREELGARIETLRIELTARIESVRADLTTRNDETNNRIDYNNRRMDSMSEKFDDRLNRLYEAIVRREEHSGLERRVLSIEQDVADMKQRLAA